MIYDHVIIGGGPTGLTLAWILSKYNKKVALIDKNNSLGGCHRVHRVNNGLFSEHGPRIYLDCYLMFRQILNEMGYDFYDLFTEYNFQISNIGGDIFSQFTFTELLKLSIAFILLNDADKKITIKQYLNEHNFTPMSIDYIDRLCRLVDGGGIDTYTLYNFLQILNQKVFHFQKADK